VSFLQTVLMVLGLTMDTLAVAIAVSLYHAVITFRLVFRISFHFALFQAGLLFLGATAGSFLQQYASAYDHWVAFGLLWAIGLKMLWEATHPEYEEVKADPSRGFSLVFLSVATSLDALAVGGSLGLLDMNVTQAVTITWVMTVIISALGLFIGKKVGKMFGKRAELLGGIVLCAIGVKVLLSHLM